MVPTPWKQTESSGSLFRALYSRYEVYSQMRTLLISPALGICSEAHTRRDRNGVEGGGGHRDIGVASADAAMQAWSQCRNGVSSSVP